MLSLGKETKMHTNSLEETKFFARILVYTKAVLLKYYGGYIYNFKFSNNHK